MHPILFKIPLPTMPLPLFWALLAAAGVAFAVAAWQLATRRRFVEAAVVGWRSDNPGAAASAEQAVRSEAEADRRSSLTIAAVIGAAGVVAAFYFKGQTYDLSPVPIYSYGVMLGLSLVVGWYLTLGLADRDGMVPKEVMANNYVVTAIAAVVGSRVLYILTNLGEFDSVGDLFAMRRGGLVAYGGFIGGFIGSYFYLRKHNYRLMPWADVAVPSLATGLTITRIGCYLFGCDFGKPLDPPGGTASWAPGWLRTLGSFPHWPAGTLEHGGGAPAWVQHVKERGLSQTATHSLAVHPTQLYESLAGVAILVLLLVARRHQKFRGQIFFLFTFAYGVWRYLVEILRDDAERGSIPPSLPEHVLLPLGLAILALGYVIGFSQVIRNMTVRRVTQVAAFLPPLALYVLLAPESFGGSASIQLSTSQAVAVVSGFAVSLAFSVFYKAALAHPEAAMAINIPAVGAAPTSSKVVDDDEDDEQDEPAERQEARPKRKKASAAAETDAPKKPVKAKRKIKRPAPAPDDGGEAAGEQAGEPAGATKEVAAAEAESAGEPKAKPEAEPAEGA